MSTDKASAPTAGSAAPPASAAPAAAAAAKPKLTPEEVKKMVEAKREALKAQKAAEDAKAAKEAKDSAKDTTRFFGVHTDITCDGCNVKPIVGFRYKCKHCANHDFCEECYAAWQKGTLRHKNARNPVSKRVEDHVWETHVDPKQFKAAVENTKKEAPKQHAASKVKPNDPCTCGSNKKYKKCCGAEGGAKDKTAGAAAAAAAAAPAAADAKK